MSLELDAHHDAADARLTDFREAGGREHATGADMKLAQQSVLRNHRVALDRTGAMLPGEVEKWAAVIKIARVTVE